MPQVKTYPKNIWMTMDRIIANKTVSIAMGNNRCVVLRFSYLFVFSDVAFSLQLPQPVMSPEDMTLRRCQVLSRPRSDIFHETMELTLRHRDIYHLTSGGPMAPWMPAFELF